METSKEIIAYSDYALYSVSEEADTAYLLNVTVKPDTAAPVNDVEPAPENAGQLPGQMQMRLNELPPVPARRPRPPRSCRRPRT